MIWIVLDLSKSSMSSKCCRDFQQVAMVEECPTHESVDQASTVSQCRTELSQVWILRKLCHRDSWKTIVMGPVNQRYKLNTHLGSPLIITFHSSIKDLTSLPIQKPREAHQQVDLILSERRHFKSVLTVSNEKMEFLQGPLLEMQGKSKTME